MKNVLDISDVLASQQVLGTVPVYLNTPDAIFSQEILQELGQTRLELLEKVKNDDPGASGFLPLLFDAEMDAVSHFLLRVLCCNDGAASVWMIDAEEALLKLRWEQASDEEQCAALKQMNFVPESQGPRSRWVNLLVTGESMPYAVSMPFTDLPPKLLAERRCKLRKGLATVERQDFLPLLCQCFRRHLQTVLQKSGQHVELLLRDSEQLKQTVDHLRPQLEQFLLSSRGDEAGVNLQLSNFQEMYEKSFPPCMQYLVKFQRDGKHLKHLGRKQLRPLLREAGLPLEEALAWWRREFLRDVTVTQESFDSEHAYHIKHAYGLEGKRKPAYGWSCWRTLDQMQFPVPKGPEAHGCPFTSLEEADLRELLRQHGGGDEVLTQEVSPPVGLASEQICCARVFQSRHPGSEFEAMKHPMQFLRRSRAYYAAQLAGEAEASSAAQVQVMKENCVPNPKKPRICRKPLRVAQLDQFDPLPAFAAAP